MAGWRAMGRTKLLSEAIPDSHIATRSSRVGAPVDVGATEDRPQRAGGTSWITQYAIASD